MKYPKSCKFFLWGILLTLVFLPGVAAASGVISTDAGTESEVLVSGEANNRIIATTFVNVPANKDLTFSALLKASDVGTNHSVLVEIGNTTDYQTITGPTYTTAITGLTSTISWVNVTIPNTYDFQGNVIVRLKDEGARYYSLRTDIAADNAAKKINYFYNPTTWTNETASWTYYTRLYYADRESGTLPAGSVLIGTYHPITSDSGTSVNGTTAGRSFLIYDNAARIRETCTIKSLQFYTKTGSSPGTFTIDFWRKNDSGGFDRIGQTENLMPLLVPGLNTVTNLNIPVKEGDYYGFSSVDGGFDTHASSNSVMYYCETSSASSKGFAWTSQNSVSNLIWNMAMYTDSVDTVFIGDSIIAGHPSHDSYLESNATHTASTHTISYQYSVNSDKSSQNMGIGGQTTTQTLARFQADVIDLNPTNVVIEGGVNDVAQGVSSSTILSNIESEVSAAESAGIKPYLVLILPWSNANTAQSDQVNYLNTQYQALTSTYTTLEIIDARSTVGDQSGTRWDIKSEYNADGVHFTENGYDLLGQFVSDAMSGVTAPTAAFSASASSGSVPLVVQFTDQSTNTPTSWLWDFGDGATSTAQNPTHTYSTAGTYTVVLAVSNSGGSDATPSSSTEYNQIAPTATGGEGGDEGSEGGSENLSGIYNINWTEAHQSINNLSASNYSDPINMHNYKNYTNFTNVSATNQTQTVNALVSPFEEVWLPIYGYYIYFILIITITTVVFFKTRDLGSASSALLLLCALCAARTDIITSPFINTFEVLVGIGITGVLIKIFASKE